MPCRKIISRISTICVVAIVLSYSAMAQVVDYGTEYGVHSFEQSAEGYVASRHSRVQISNLHSKLGNSSLEFSWNRTGENLTYKGPIPYLSKNPNPAETSVSTFVFWVYSEKPSDSKMRISFLKEGRECCHFDYGMNFTGWRGAWVAFDRDMTGTPEEGMDSFVIHAPSGQKKGRLFFDCVIPSAFEDIRHHSPDFQAPYVNENTKIHWLVLNRNWNKVLDVEQKSCISETDIEDMSVIRERFISLVRPKGKVWNLEQVRKVFESYSIVRNPDGTLRGKPIFFTRFGETFINLGIRNASASFKKNGQLLRQYNDNLLAIAEAWLRSDSDEERAEIAGMYVLMTEHLLDQGFEAGSGLGTVHHLGYSMRNFYTSHVIMKDVLSKAGISEKVQMAMEWFSGVGEVKTAPEEEGMDIDAFNTSLMGRVASLLMLEDGPYKYAYLKALARWVDNGFKYADGTKPCFKKDGTIYHHRKCYPAYAVGGLDGAVNIVWMLRGTAFAISPESHAILKESLLAMRFYCNLRSFPLAMSGRHPDGKGELNPRHYLMMAQSGTPDGRQEEDSEMMGAYLRLCGKSDDSRAEKAPQGSRAFNFNCSLSHRCGEALVTIAGHSRYLWSAEIYKGANHYGRYLTHGSMQILSGGEPIDGESIGGEPIISAKGSGFQVDGWDWCHIPGTTAAEIPMEKMKANVLNVDEFSGYEEMLLSDELFAGAVTYQNRYGLFAMKLHENDKYNGSLRARKSFFAFGDRIIALGSNLENSLEGSELHTTLFQNTITPDTPTMADGETITSMDYSGTFAGPVTVLGDRFGNTYYIKDASVRLSRGIQHSLHEETDAPTTGTFEKAYICHGDLVQDGRYEYMVRLASDKARNYKSFNGSYKVIRCDRNVHEVKDMESSVTGAAVFEEGAVDSLVRYSTPALVMYSMQGYDLNLSLCNPDLALYEGDADVVIGPDGKSVERSVYSRSWINNPCGKTYVKITLKGLWDIIGDSDCIISLEKDGDTTIVVETTGAMTKELKLTRILM